jgi:hypothetical protein
MTQLQGDVIVSVIIAAIIGILAFLAACWLTRAPRKPRGTYSGETRQPARPPAWDPQLPAGIPTRHTERLAPMPLSEDPCGCRHLFGGWLVPCPDHDPRHNGADLQRLERDLSQ